MYTSRDPLIKDSVITQGRIVSELYLHIIVYKIAVPLRLLLPGILGGTVIC